MKKILNVLLIVVLVLQTMTGSIMLPSFAAANDDEETIFQAVTITDVDGNEIGVDESSEQDVIVHVDWSIQGLEVSEGYQEALSLPDELVIAHDQTVELIFEEQEVGIVHVSDDQTVTVTFHEVIEEMPGAEGSFDFEAVFVPATTEDVETIDEEVEESLESELAEDEEMTEEDAEEVEHSEEVTEDADEAEAPKEEAEGDESESDLHSSSMSTMSGAGEITENIITGVTLSIGEGEELEPLEDGDLIVVKYPYEEKKYELVYEFELPNNHGYGAGAIYTIEVPEMFEIPQIHVDEAIDLARVDGVVFGKFHTDGNNVIITFNENIEERSDIRGEIELSSNFDADYDGVADGDVITFPIGGEDTLEFPIKFIRHANAIDKQGVGNRGYNTETITWTVDVNKNLQEIENATLTDVIEEGDHSFVDGSLRVYELVMNANGTVDEAIEITMDHDFEVSAFPELELGFIDSAYRFVYETEINDDTGTTYRNNATLDGDHMDLPSTTNASVVVTRGQPLEKDSIDYDNVSQTITWEVRYNFDEKAISQGDAKLTDVFGDDNQQLIEGSFEVIAVEIDPDTGDEIGESVVSPSDYEITETSEGFELQFNNDINQAYRIVYQTTAIDRVAENVNVMNTISDEFENDSSAEQSISQGIFIKSHDSTDYASKETNWSIVINRDEHVMENVVFRDTLPVGFTLEDIDVNHGDYDYDYNEGTREIVITFNGTITEQVTIHYTTSIDFDVADRSSNHTNNAHLEWIPEGEEDTVERTATATFTPDDYTQDNGFKHGSYNLETKEITWTIGVNYNNETLDGVVIEDFILGDQNFDISDVRIYEMELTEGENDYGVGADVTGDFDINPASGPEDEDGFTVSLGDITGPYIIEYTTNLVGEHVAATYNNEAVVSSDNKDPIELGATVNPTYGGEYVNKRGQQNTDNGRIVNWSIDLNFSQSRVIDYEIVDMLSANQTIRQETFTVYGTTVNGNSIVKDESTVLEEGTDYEVEFTEDEDTGQESFTLIFTREIEEAYMLEYDSYILYEGDGNYRNSANVSGEIPGDETQTSDNVDTSISFNNISGSITGEVGSLQITKVDAEDENVTLEGAVFELWDEFGEVLLKTAETDEDGIATFTNLLYADYQLKETEAPEFYVVGIEDQQQVTVNDETVADGITIENEKIKQHFELTKVDDVDGTPLEGVEFELYQGSYPDGTLVAETYITNSEGEILIEHLPGGNADEGLPAGDYYLIETAAKEHYELSTNPIIFTINQDQTVVTTETVENSLTPGSLIFEKVDSESGEHLEGAVFTLEYLDYDGNDYDTSRTLTTDDDGRVEVDDLRPGNYRLTEQTPPRGYEFSADIEEEFEIVESQTTAIDLGQFGNEVKTTNLTLTKVDAIDSSITLAGVEFTLSYVGDDYVIADQVDETDSNGEITFEDLKPGEYHLIETAVPDDYGYIQHSDPIQVTVTIDDVHDEIDVVHTVTNDPFKEVVLTKVDSESGTSLAGALFNLLDEEGNMIREDLETNAQGEIRITGLAPGEYTFVETRAPLGYNMGTDNDGTFSVTGSETETELEPIPFSNDIITGSVEITKVDAEDNDILLEGVAFTLESVDLVNGGDPVLETGLTTDADGKLVIDDLRPGTYQLTETTAHDGYQLHWQQPIEFTIDLADEDGVSHEHELTVENYQLVDIDVTKQWNDNWIDDENDAERPDSITVILLQNGSELDTQEIDEESNWTHEFTGLDAVDSEGDPYEYTIEELDESGYESEIEGSVEDGFVITNTAKTTSLELTKQDSINGQLLSGAEFTLEYPNGTTTQGTTEEDGTLTFENLQPGVYTLTETTAPEGYIANSTSIEITVSLDDVEGETVITRTITNAPFANVTFTKVDAETEVVLTGAEFKVIDADGEDVEGFTDLSVESDGTLSITGLPVGDYKLVETAAPTGYELSTEEVEFTVSADADTELIELADFDNEITRGSVTFTKLNDENETLAGIEFLLDSTELVNDVDDAYSVTHYTDEDGIMLVEDLRPGTYTFTEIYPDGYQHYTGEDLTFTIDPVDGDTAIDFGEVINYELVDIEVTKVWQDDHNATGDRPNDSGIAIELYRQIEGGTEDFVESVTLTEANVQDDDDHVWSYTFADLDAVDADGLPYTYSVAEASVPAGYEAEVDGYTIINTLTGTTDIEVEKVWLDDNQVSERPDEITLKLFQNGEELEEEVAIVVNPGDGGHWFYTFEDLPAFDEEGQMYEYTIEEEPVDGYEQQSLTGNMEDGFVMTNVRVGTTDIEVTKEWLDGEGEDRPEEITVYLVQNDELLPFDEAQVSLEDGWTYTFTNVPVYDDQGVEYTYTIVEEEVAGYETSIDGYDITNLRVGTIDVEVTKTWRDDNLADRPESITVNVLQNGIVLETEDITADTDWEHTFTDLPEFDSEGVAYEYTVTEHDVPGYNSEVDGYEITNTRSEEKSIAVTKGWLDDDSEDRPESITVNLLQNGNVYETVDITEEEDWTYEFENLAAYDDAGQAIEYTIEEEPVDGYETTIAGYDITNLRAGTTSIEVTKAWLDGVETDRPESITVYLLQDGEEFDVAQVTAEAGWAYTFTDVPLYDDQGVEYTYTVEEEPVAGYETSIDGFEITNLRVGTIDVEGTKTWLDDNSDERPATIEVNLLQNGEVIAVQEVSGDTDWQYSFTDLDQFDDEGVAYSYTVEEEPLDGYDITNVRVGTTSIEVTKEWIDGEGEDRPESITVYLLQNGEAVSEATITTADDWAYTFTDVPLYDDQGVEYTYTIEEEPVAGYETSIDGFEITNLRVGTIDVEGTKTWLDDNSDERPATIEVNLLQNGEVIAVQEVSGDTNWQYSFTDLDQFDDEGVAYVYTVEEEPVDGYEATVDGYDITNLRVGTTSVEVTKEWIDGEGEDRPESITVYLLQNGEVVTEATITAADDWAYTFTNLAKYDDQGVEYTYTVEEEEVAGYEASIDGYEITNLRVGTIDVEVAKTWRDDHPGDRPEEIFVNLLRNGVVVDTAEITAQTDWEHTFTDLAKFDREGIAYEYTVTEHDVPGYHSEVDGYDITNTRSEEKSIVVTKGWLDDDSKDRPISITVTLLQNGNVYETVTITEEDGWTYEFANLDAYDATGQAIEYTIEEEPVEGYKTTINGFDITNLRVGTTSVEGTKTWVNDTPEDRPDSIVVVLYQNGIELETKTVTRSDNWQYSFMDLPKFDDSGVAYEYTISEMDVDGYRSEVDGYNLINTFIPIAPEEEEVQEVISDVTDTTEEDGGTQLPSTATNLFNIVLFGAGFIALGLLILMIARRQRKA
ncbi:Cna B-type domain-containing protein [Alkalihalobacillus hemicellulosilyticus]|uniref:Collagen adhesion protein n=1 Tax=Halalkalibacter hemicellulosilyticusJCM 9152 TaxID=1236971 RepID=W4QJM3_9BACI|nr:Cna B-type domain-containing protein [Halalkalibacter hemicellulosilyticus]GAE31828.1 hypothetical protein JCM9152_3321 [Halalkalibacter hemicellulosilyticusJCM 9152]